MDSFLEAVEAQTAQQQQTGSNKSESRRMRSVDKNAKVAGTWSSLASDPSLQASGGSTVYPDPDLSLPGVPSVPSVPSLPGVSTVPTGRIPLRLPSLIKYTLPHTPEEIAAYMQKVPERCHGKATPYWGRWRLSPGDLRNLRLAELVPSYSKEEVAALSRETPHLELSSAGLFLTCRFIETCAGEGCLGLLVLREGEYGRKGREILCPEHWQLFRDHWANMRTGWLRREAQVPDLYDADFVWPGRPTTMRQVETLLGKNPAVSLLLWGPPGTYKTSLAVKILERRLDAGQEGMFISVTDLLLRLQAGFKRKCEHADDTLLERVVKTPVLVLDDLGKQKGSKWVGEILFEVINERQANKRQTIVTSNHPIRQSLPDPSSIPLGEALEERLGGDIAALALVDRLANQHFYKQIRLAGASGRLKKR